MNLLFSSLLHWAKVDARLGIMQYFIGLILKKSPHPSRQSGRVDRRKQNRERKREIRIPPFIPLSLWLHHRQRIHLIQLREAELHRSVRNIDELPLQCPHSATQASSYVPSKTYVFISDIRLLGHERSFFPYDTLLQRVNSLSSLSVFNVARVIAPTVTHRRPIAFWVMATTQPLGQKVGATAKLRFHQSENVLNK